MNNNNITVLIGLLLKAWVVEYCKFHKMPCDSVNDEWFNNNDDWFNKCRIMGNENKEDPQLIIREIQEYILDYCISHRVRYFPRSPVILRMKSIITHNRK